MIYLEPSLEPSFLLYEQDIPPFLQRLLRQAEEHQRAGDWERAIRCIEEVRQYGQEGRSSLEQSLALVHLADVYRAMGRLGPARRYAHQAYTIFHGQVSRPQQHNEGVAAYSLGLIHQLLGDYGDAQRWYHTARQQFEVAREYWASRNERDLIHTCVQMDRWLEALSEYVTSAQTRPALGRAGLLWMPIPLDGDEKRFAVAELDVDKLVLGREVVINGQTFRIQPLKGNRRVSLSLGSEYSALEIPQEAFGSLQAGKGDYALVVWEEARRKGPGVLRSLGEPSFGDFERDSGGEVSFTSYKSGRQTVIGGNGEEDLKAGYIVALLNRV